MKCCTLQSIAHCTHDKLCCPLADTRLMSDPGWLEKPEKNTLSSLFPLYICHLLPYSESQELTLCQVPAGTFLLLWPLKRLTFAKT